MRNRYPGTCYFCGEVVEKGQGHFERRYGTWVTIHVECVKRRREEKIAAPTKGGRG